MLWSIFVEKVPQASEHLCPPRLQAMYDHPACQSICLFIPSDFSRARAVDYYYYYYYHYDDDDDDEYWRLIWKALFTRNDMEEGGGAQMQIRKTHT